MGLLANIIHWLKPTTPQLGTDYAVAGAAGVPDDIPQAMSAYGAFPWVVACLRAITTDLGGVPLVVEQRRGGRWTAVEGHPLQELLEQPTPAHPGVLWRAQQLVDLYLTGNAYTLQVYASRLLSLPRLHPERVELYADETRAVAGYRYSAGIVVSYMAADVMHVRLPSYAPGPAGEYGQGLIKALTPELNADLRASTLAANVARRGRPDVIVSPTDGAMLSRESIQRIKEAWNKLMSDGGALVLDGSVKVDMPAFTPRDMEFQASRAWTRDTVLAAFGVPPTRVGLPTANYATAREQSQVYWDNLRGVAALLDAGWRQLARRWYGRDIRVRHDFSGVPILQDMRNAQLGRVSQWVLLGADPAKAAEYEGLTGHPLEADAPAPPPEKAIDRKAWRGWTHPVTRGTEDRGERWKGWNDTVRLASIRAIGRSAKQVLSAQAERASQALVNAMPEDPQKAHTRASPDAVIEAVLKAIGDGSDLTTLDPALRDSLRRSFKAAVQGLSEAQLQSWAEDPEVRAQLADLIGNLTDTTRSEVRALLLRGLDEGWTVGDLQAQLVGSQVFSAQRALAIARTESTRSVSAGTHLGMKSLVDEGLTVRREWLARPGARPAHAKLDGQTVGPDEPFKTEDGHKAHYPGGFGVAALDINCTCAVVARVTDPDEEGA